MPAPEVIDKARRAAEAALRKQASDILLLDMRQVCSFADYFIICSADTRRQIEAVRDEIRDALSQDGIKPLHQEGGLESGWLLMDFGEVVVHIFDPEQRQFYALEEHWSQAPTLLRIQ